MAMDIIVWTNRVIRLGFYLLFILVPLILTPWNFELFEYNKMMITYALTAIIIGAWATKMIAKKEFFVTRTPLDIPIALFVVSQLVSTLFSIDPHVSWFGYYSRFNGGMISILCYFLLYYALVSNIEKQTITRLLIVTLSTAVLVSIYGVLEHFGIDKDLWVQDVQSRVFSTLGQPNWLGAYIVALIPLSLAFGLKKTYWFAMSILFFLTLLYTRSRSGYLGLAVAELIFWLFLFLSQKDKKVLVKPFSIFHGIFFIIVFFNGVYISQIDPWVTLKGWQDRFTKKTETPAPAPTTPSGTLLEYGGTESGTIRKYVWQGAIDAWRATPKNLLIGTGTETFAFAFYQYRPVGHNTTSEWDFLYNKAHNEYLNYLATTGIFGLGAYLSFIAVFVLWFLKNHKKHDSALFALFSGWVSILVTNFFGFSVVIMQLLLFLIPAIIFALHSFDIVIKKPIRFPMWTKFIPGMLSLAVLIILARFWKADMLYANGSRLTRSGLSAQAQTALAQSIKLNPGEPIYHDELASNLAQLALAAAGQENATLAASLAEDSINESNLAISISPKNVNFYKTRTKLYYSFSSFDPALNTQAVKALEDALALSPNDPKIYYNLAILNGRSANNDLAVEQLKKAKALKPNYRDAYFGLYVFYTELKKPDLARAELQSYLDTIDPNDTDFKQRLQQ